MKHIYTRSGQTLVEAIIVISVVLLLVTGLVSGTTASMKSGFTGRVRTHATKLAEEGLEYARQQRDQGWDTFSALVGSYCLGDDAEKSLVATADESCQDTITTTSATFTRVLTFTTVGDRVTVESKVSYLDGAETKHVNLVTYLTDWK
jgi:type II secretory pathway pseudopilin PulG